MKILNIISPHASNGCSFYRSWGVFNELRKEVDVRFVENLKYDWNNIMQSDGIFMERPSIETHYSFIDVAIKCGVPVWADWDDDLLNVPKTNPTYHEYSKNTSTVKKIIASADIITLATESLKNNYQLKNAIVLENYIPLQVKYIIPKKTNKFRIFWRGSNTHDADWFDVLPQVLEFIKGKNIHFYVIGDFPVYAGKCIQRLCPITHIQSLPKIMEYFNFLQKEQIADVCIVPLENNLFNQAKSNIATQEALVNGMLSVHPTFNHTSPYGYKDNILESLEKIYVAWQKHNTFVEEVVDEQRNLRERKKMIHNHRVTILKQFLNIN